VVLSFIPSGIGILGGIRQKMDGVYSVGPATRVTLRRYFKPLEEMPCTKCR